MMFANTKFMQKAGKCALFVGAILFALGGLAACSNPNQAAEESHVHGSDTHRHDDTEEAHADEMGEEHGHEHAEEDEHAHAQGEEHDQAEEEHAEDDHDHEHEIPEDVQGIMDAIASTHETVETAETDEEVIDIHHAPYEIVELFEALREKVELSEEQAAEYDKLLVRIDKTAGLIDDHAHEEDIAMVRNLIERINGDIEALENVVMPDHEH